MSPAAGNRLRAGDSEPKEMLRMPPSTCARSLRSSEPCIGDCWSRPRMANSSIVAALHPPSVRCIETIHRQVNPETRAGERTPPGDVREAPREGAGAYIDAVPERRSVVDYSLQRRAVLA